MDIESRQTIHAGVNFIFVPSPIINKGRLLDFQQKLDEFDIDISRVEYLDEGIVAIRQPKHPIQITISSLQQHTGQLLMVFPLPGRPLESVEAESESIVNVFNQVWSEDRRQVLSSDATIRDLYNTSSDHAFKELWEKRLGQTPGSLSLLGAGLAGGGLRFVIPPTGDDPCIIEVKIESYLRDSSKLFIEAQFKWPGPSGTTFNPTEKLERVNQYITKKVVEFIKQGDQT